MVRVTLTIMNFVFAIIFVPETAMHFIFSFFFFILFSETNNAFKAFATDDDVSKTVVAICLFSVIYQPFISFSGSFFGIF